MKIQECGLTSAGQPSPFFCKLQKIARIGGENLRQINNFSTRDRLTIDPRHDQSVFQGQ